MNYMDTRAYLIDPIKKAVMQIKYSYIGDYQETARAIRCNTIDAVDLDDKHVVWVDDEGLFRPKFVFLWKIKSLYYPEGKELAGMALVTGIDEEGETVPPTMSIEELNDSLTFHQHPLVRKDML